MKKEQKLIYRIIAQTDTITITAQTSKAVTEEAAYKDVPLVTANNTVERFIVFPVATQESWDNGHINFCPRCGTRQEYIQDNYSRFECSECNAEVDCNITTYDEVQDDYEEEDSE